jgi:hypothetical protein
MKLFPAPIHPRVCGNRTVTSIPEWLKMDHAREVIEPPLSDVLRAMDSGYVSAERCGRKTGK